MSTDYYLYDEKNNVAWSLFTFTASAHILSDFKDETAKMVFNHDAMHENLTYKIVDQNFIINQDNLILDGEPQDD